MNIVRELRKKKGVQQKELALIIGVAQPTISEWEANKKDPSGERLKKLAEYFGVDELTILGRGIVDLNKTELFVPIDPKICGMSETEQITQYVLNGLEGKPKTPEARLLAKGVDTMPQEQRQAILNLVMSLRPDAFMKGTEEDDT